MIQGDEPIKTPEDDLLGRSRLAQVIAGEVRRIDATAGAVVGILGPWGSGKTSLINLIEHELQSPPWVRGVRFNPWMFSGADQLVDRFFLELAAQLRSGPNALPNLSDAFEKYAEVVSPLQAIPIVGPWIGLLTSAGKGLKELRALRRGGSEQQRRRVADQLKLLDSPILVIIDDIDRLRVGEIRDIFKLIRLTGNFPNIIYMVAFDRARVEQALGEEGLPGRDYLEKIIQVVHDIPLIPAGVLTRQITGAIDRIFEGVENAGHFDESRWPDVFYEIMRPLFRTMRDVRRYADSISGTILGLDGRIELVDVLALEAVRIFLPDVFSKLGLVRHTLTEPPPAFELPDADEKRRGSINILIATNSEHGDVVRAMVHRLFPRAAGYVDEMPYGGEWMARWLRDRRVAHPNHFNFYLERVVSAELDASSIAEQAFGLLTDRQALESLFRSVDPGLWEDVIRGLETYEDDFLPEATVPTSVVLLNLLPELPKQPRGFFDFDPEMAARRVVYRLFRRLASPDLVEQAVRKAIPGIERLSGKLILVTMVGQEENVGHDLITPEAAAVFERTLRDEVRAASGNDLAKEFDLLRLLLWVKHRSGPDELALNLQFQPPVGCVVLRSALSQVRIQGMGTRAVRVELRLAWDAIVELFGSEDAVRQTVEACGVDTDDPLLSEAVQLARRYLEGWRPERF